MCTRPSEGRGDKSENNPAGAFAAGMSSGEEVQTVPAV